MTHLLLPAALAALIVAPPAFAQSAQGSPTAPPAGGGVSTTGPSGGVPARGRRMMKPTTGQPAKSRRDIEDEKRLDHDMKICIGC